MRFLKYYAVLLSIMVQTIAGCGGGGGSTATNPPVSDTTAPTVSAFTLPVTNTSLTVAISSFSATDSVGVTGYLVTESATAPSASATGWSTTAPASYTFSGAGSVTGYAWAKDAAGNISTGRSASVTITLPPKTVTLKISSQSSNVTDVFNGFDFAVTLPVGSVLLTDTSGVPTSSAVYLSGQFTGAVPQIMYYDDNLRKLTASYISLNKYQLGEFITIMFTVPDSYVPNTSDIAYSFTAWDIGGVPIPTITATATFN